MNVDGFTGLLLGWLTSALAFWLCRKGWQWWRHQRYGRLEDDEALLVKYARQMSAALDRQGVAHLLTVDVPHALQANRVVLLLPQEHQLIDVEANELRLPISHAAVRWVASGGEAQHANRGRLRELIQQGRADLHWTSLWVPLMRGAELRGMWLLGARSGGLHYAPEDLNWLTTLGRQAAVILDALHYAEREQKAAAEIRALYYRVVAAQEVERNRLARDLHDGALQDLCAVTRDLKALAGQSQAKESVPADLAVRSGEAVRFLRSICHELRPPLLQHDLAAALKTLVEQLGAGTRSSLSLQVTCGELHLADDLAVAVFRIAQEALRNAIQHADASEIEVRLINYPDRLRLTVTDDGRGIPGGIEAGRFVEKGHFGLAGMRERAAMVGGRLEVHSAPDYGTVVVLELPH